MGDHEHDWKPIEGVAARYACACGAEGWKNVRTGVISAYKSKPGAKRAVTMRPSAGLATSLRNGNRRLGDWRSRR